MAALVVDPGGDGARGMETAVGLVGHPVAGGGRDPTTRRQVAFAPMHACPLFVIDPSPFAPTEEIDQAVRDFEEVALALRELDAPAAIHLSGPLLAALAARKIEPGLGDVEWVRTGWAAPDLTSIPDRLALLALSHEAEAMRRIGVEPGSLWVRGWWDRRIPHLVAGAGVDSLILHADLLGEREPGVVAFLDRVLPVIPLMGHLPDARSDGLVLFTVSASDPARNLEAAMEACRGRILTPRSYLTDHNPTGRYHPTTEVPSEDRESARLRRKMIRLATRIPDKLTPSATEDLLAGCHGPAHARGASADLRRGAHEALVRARRTIDADRRRGDDWTRVSRVDWDADGVEELQVELATLSIVVDPTESGEILSLDDKALGWAVNVLDTESGGALFRFTDMEGSQTDAALAVHAVEESKGSVTVDMTGPVGSGSVRCRLEMAGHKVSLAYELAGSPRGRAGLELPLATGTTRTRVDGSEWSDLADATPLAGHRFRFSGSRHQVLVTSLTPAQCFTRPSPGGIVLWLHWEVEGAASHEATIDLSPST